MWHAITREVSPAVSACELTHLDREPIDLARAVEQHERYCIALEGLGCRVTRLGAEPDFPDSVFVEDVAVVLDEVAVMTRPGAPSRRDEGGAVARALAADREVVAIKGPGTLDGGDVVVLGQAIYVGLSSRSDSAGVESLRACVEPFGYRVHGVDVRGCLHLKTACTAVNDETLLVNPEWVDPEEIEGAWFVQVDPGEPFGANVLRVGEELVHDVAYPRTRERLESAGYTVAGVDLSELAKAEGAVTCSSLVYSVPD